MLILFRFCPTKMVLLGRVGHMYQFTLFQTEQNLSKIVINSHSLLQLLE